MKLDDLLNTLIDLKKDIGGDVDVRIEYSQSDCHGHPEGEYCYCGYTDIREDFSVCTENHEKFNKKKLPKKMESPIVLFRVT